VPRASLTQIGWIVRGTIRDKDTSQDIRSHTIFAEGEDVDKLAQQLKRFCDIEDFGTEHQQPGVSEIDELAIQILENNPRRLEVGYEVPILWKTGEPSLPNNRLLAESRALHQFTSTISDRSRVRGKLLKGHGEKL
jgi:hypothetical protein